MGTVRDPSGAPIANASVAAVQIETGFSYRQAANSAGAYVLSNLPIGTYTVTFSAPSFRDLRFEGIQTHPGSVLRQDATLELASVSTTVQVESSTPMVHSETAEIGQLVDSRQITQLPLNGRDVYSLLDISAGAETGVSPSARFTTAERPTLAGGRAGYTVFRVNGIDVNSQNLPSASISPSVDAVQEFRAITQLAPASESSTSTVSVSLKSGTNDFHGTAYEFFRNDALDAHPFFERELVTPSFQSQPDRLRYNQFGGVLGGPIQKDRTFFFGSVQLTRIRTLTQVTGIHPTDQMLQGDFSGINPLSGSALANFKPVIDPQTMLPFAGNRIPASRFSSFTSKFLPVAFLPANCLACQAEGLGFNFVGEAPGYTNGEQYLARMDHRFGEQDTLTGALQIQPTDAVSTPSPNPVSAMDTPTRAYFAGIDETHIFTPSLVNELRFGYTRLRATLQQEQDAHGAFTFQNTPTSLPSLFPTVTLAGYSPRFGNGAISDRNFSLEDSWDFSNNVNWIHGRHEVKAGFEGIRAHFWNTVNFNAFFIYADNLSPASGFTGAGFADFLLGLPFEGLTFQGTGKADMVERSVYAGYVQDSWKPLQRLTVNLGLRYEFPQRWHDRDTSLNRLGTLDTSAASQALGGRFLLGGSPDYYLPGKGVVQGTGAPLVRGSLVDPAWQNFQPRIGLAFRPFRDNKTAIRAGFGVYFAIQDANSLAFEMLSPPFQYQNLLVNTSGRPLHDSQFWPAVPPNGIATEGDDPRNRDPRLYEWTASIEHQAGNSLLLSAEYLGNHGVKNPFTVLINTPSLPNAAQLAQLEANPTLNVPLAQARAPFSGVSVTYQYKQNIAQSWYDALNLRAEERLGQRMNISAVYTWSKALDMTSAEQELPGVISNLGLGKSYSDYDHPQRFVASWAYDLPFEGNALVSGWELTGISTFESGAPYSVTMGVDTSFTGAAGPVYPNLTGPPVYSDIRSSNGIYLTPKNFSAPPFGEYGSLARNAFHGPGVNNFDLGFIKNLSLTERLRLQIRGEMFNAFNHAQFEFAGAALASSIGPPPAGSTLPEIRYVDPSQFGRVTARPPRVVQFGLKLNW
ncbi:MAG TPA: TonB-dependent receptor [Bryobacteraceae bacterium]|nr:TonB-dependent receptor [Bryobacteraceae bacterium]